MRRIERALFLVLTLFIMLLLVACGGGDATEETTAPLAASTSATFTTTRAPFVASIAPEHLTFVERLESLPRVSDGMSVEEARALCVEIARIQMSLLWTPSEDMSYYESLAGDPENDGRVSLEGGRIYGGLPYNNAGGSPYTFLDFYDGEIGVLYSPSEQFFKQTLGNNCAQSLFWSLARVCHSIKMVPTRYMNVHNGYIPLGDYHVSDKITDFHLSSTKSIASSNGNSVMYEAYALLLPADGLVRYHDGSGHTILVSAEPVVVRDPKGKIDPQASYITIIDQSYFNDERFLEDGTEICQIGGIDRVISFSKLYNNGYLPFRVAEFSGDAEITAPYAALDVDAESFTDDEFVSAFLESSHAISKVRILLTDGDGRVAFDAVRYPHKNNIYKQSMRGAFDGLDGLPIGHYSLRLTALLSTGDTVEVFSGGYEVTAD